MRKIFAVVLLALCMCAFIPEQSGAQFSTNASEDVLNARGRIIKFVGIVTTTGAITSNSFTLDGSIGENLVTYPVALDYSLDTNNANPGTEIDSVKAILFGSNDETNYIAVDTLSATLGTTAQTYATMDLNSRKLAYYRWAVTGLGSNTSSVIKINMYAYRRTGTNP